MKKKPTQMSGFFCAEHGELATGDLKQLKMPSKVTSVGIVSYGVICGSCERALTIKGMDASCSKCDVTLAINTATWHYDTKKQVWIHNCKIWRSANGTTGKQKTSKI